MDEHDQTTRLLIAELRGEAMRHARWEPPDETVTAAAVAELRLILAGRDDGPALLAEVAGVLIGAHNGQPGEFRARVAASFLIAAGADEALADQWIAEGRRRRAQADLPPFGMGALVRRD